MALVSALPSLMCCAGIVYCCCVRQSSTRVIRVGRVGMSAATAAGSAAGTAAGAAAGAAAEVPLLAFPSRDGPAARV